MDSVNLLDDPNFLIELRKLHFKVIADKLSKWENISNLDLYADPNMNAEMERLFGSPVYQEHKTMLNEAAGQPRFCYNTMEEVITTMTKERIATMAEEENKEDQPIGFQGSRNDTFAMKPIYWSNQKSSIGKTTNWAAATSVPTKEIKTSFNLQAVRSSSLMHPYSTITDATHQALVSRNLALNANVDVMRVLNQRAHDLPSFDRLDSVPRAPRALINNEDIPWNENLPICLLNLSNYPVIELPYNLPIIGRLDSTSSILMNNEQAIISCEEMATSEEFVATEPSVPETSTESLQRMSVFSIQKTYTTENAFSLSYNHNDVSFRNRIFSMSKNSDSKCVLKKI